VKLLLDQNLSPQLAARLSDLFPGSAHVSWVGLAASGDDDVWTFAAAEGFTIVSKDSDFNDLAVLRGPPPKVVWLRLGNCTTRQIEEAVRASSDLIKEFNASHSANVLEITRRVAGVHVAQADGGTAQN
jgi:predicted nuclease of predicted toxin-antitoxin system